MKLTAFGVGLFLTVAGCLAWMGCAKDAVSSSDSKPVQRVEILEQPEALLDPGFTPKAASLHGVGLGDEKSGIACALTQVNDAGWFQCGSDDRARFKIDDGRVAELRLEGEILQGFGIRSMEDIEKKFGPADHVEKKTVPFSNRAFRTTFSYDKRGLHWDWLNTSGHYSLRISAE